MVSSFRVLISDSGFRAYDFGFRGSGRGIQIYFRLRVSGVGFRVWGSRFQTADFGFQVSALRLRVACFGCRV